MNATPEEVKEAVRNWSADVVDCRARGHYWIPNTARYSKDRLIIHVVESCGRFDPGDPEAGPHAERITELDARTGWVRKSHIRYAEGYLVKGLGRINGDAKGELRLASVSRFLPRRRGS